MTVAALDGVAAHTEVSVADGEEGLGAAHVGRPKLGLHERPLVDRVPLAVERIK